MLYDMAFSFTVEMLATQNAEDKLNVASLFTFDLGKQFGPMAHDGAIQLLEHLGVITGLRLPITTDVAVLDGP